MSLLGDFIRSLRPGDDQQLAADLNARRRAGHRRSIPAVARQAQAWEDRDRAQDRQGHRWYRPAR